MQNNTISMLSDLLQGDEQIITRKEIMNLTGDDLRGALSLIVNNKNLSTSQKNYFLDNSWKIFYKSRPPTMEEFLTSEWLGPTANSIFPHIRKTLLEFMSPFSEKRHLILATAIGSGKSTASAILALYIITHIALMRNPKVYFGLAKSSSICGALISFSLKKAKQLLAQPFYQILLSSPKFVRVKQQEFLERKQKEIGTDRIAWTSASKMEGILETTNDFHLLLASDPANLLGLNLLFSVMSELSFFVDRGVSPDEIWRVYNDSKGRIFSRFQIGETTRYFGITVMDSSPNDIDLPIDRYVFSGEAYKDPLNYIVTGPHWEFHPDKYIKWQKTGETFNLYKGNASKPPKIIEDIELSNYDSTDIIKVPIDAKQKFIDDVRKSTKDLAGWPSGGTNRIFDDTRVIERIFTKNLINIDTFILAPSDKSPERLIWDQIKDIFFIKLSQGYQFYRYPNLPRYIHFDLSENGDLTSIACCHLEMGKDGVSVVIVDFTVVVSPGKGRVNIDATYEFVKDLKFQGHVNIKKVTGDRYQSSALIQRLKRDNFDAELLSVDTDTAPYYTLASYIKTDRLKVGKNIILKNNLRSLIESKTEKGRKKIDHFIGPISYDSSNDSWESSTLGMNGKDCSDSVCGASFTCINYSEGIPSAIWEDREDTSTVVLDSLKSKLLKNFSLELREAI